MRHIPIPRDVSSDTQRAIQQINLALQARDIPLLKDFKSVRGIAEGTAAYFLEGSVLYRYTKVRSKLYKEKVAVPDEPAKEGSSADVLRQVEYTPQAPRKITLDYTRTVDSPRAVSFGTEWHRLLNNEGREPLAADEIPTDISFDPVTPSSEAGKHYVTVTFTPPEYGDEERIIGSVVVEEV